MMKAKKSLGQNFLSDPKILKKIADSAEINENDTVIEIGPGKGSLTLELLKVAKKVIAVEKDELLAKNLEEIFSKEITDNRLEIIVGDILNFKFEILNFKLVGNIPYYITGEIFRKFLESSNQPKSITFVIQKEVAERIIAKNKKESILSISIKAYGEPKYGGVIKKGSFFPRPKVDSAILTIKNINKDKFLENQVSEEHFFEILKLGFSHKRKFLIKNLAADKKVFERLGISEKIRAEDIGLDQWFELAKNI